MVFGISVAAVSGMQPACAAARAETPAVVPRSTDAGMIILAAYTPCNPYSPCAVACNPCNPCDPCNACAAGPCGAAAELYGSGRWRRLQPVQSLCSGRSLHSFNPCSPCGSADEVELSAAQASAAYACIKGSLRAGYANSGNQWVKAYQS